MPVNECDYQSYLLRIWRVRGEDAHSWRASLEDVKTGELHGFACLDEFVNFLNEIAQEDANGNDKKKQASSIAADSNT
jgi:hypothetical protein